MLSKKEALEKLALVNKLQNQAQSLRTIEIPVAAGVSFSDYREEIEKAKPSPKPSYWAKPSCKKCHGKGTAGFIEKKLESGNKIRHEQLCACATKAWQKWQDDFVADLKKSRLASDQAADQVPEQLALNGISPATTETKADPKQIVALEQVERLVQRIAQYQADLLQLHTRKQSLLQRQELAETMEREKEAEGEVQARQAKADELAAQLSKYEAEAERLLQERKFMLGQAALARQCLKTEAKPAVEQAKVRRQQVQKQVKQAQKSLSRAEHQVQKKIREISDRVSKLRARAERVERENNIKHSVFIEEEVDSGNRSCHSS